MHLEQSLQRERFCGSGTTAGVAQTTSPSTGSPGTSRSCVSRRTTSTIREFAMTICRLPPALKLPAAAHQPHAMCGRSAARGQAVRARRSSTRCGTVILDDRLFSCAHPSCKMYRVHATDLKLVEERFAAVKGAVATDGEAPESQHRPAAAAPKAAPRSPADKQAGDAVRGRAHLASIPARGTCKNGSWAAGHPWHLATH